jgi:cell division protein FtsB
MLADIHLSAIQDETIREQMRELLNLVEKLSADLRALREENQSLRDEIAHLKGEQGKPDIKANKVKSAETSNHSSEVERKQPRKRHGSSKKDEIKIDRQEVVKVRVADLPADAQFKGYVEVVVQDIVVKTDNVLFRKEKYYSPSTGKTYLAELPRGYEGEFGPGVKALGLDMYFEVGASEPKILGFLHRVGIEISKGKFSNLLIEDQDVFHAESDGLYESGLRSTDYQQTDSTLTRVNGQNQNCHIVCNPFYTVYRTLPHKDRLSVLDVLRNGRPRRFRLNQTALDCLANVQLSQATRQTLVACCSELELNEENFQKHLAVRGTPTPAVGIVS